MVVEPKFYRNWKPYSRKDMRKMYPDLDIDLARVAIAMASHEMMGEDPLEYVDLSKYGSDGETLKDFAHILPQLEGDPYERGVKFAQILEEKASNYALHKKYNPEYAEAMKMMVQKEVDALTAGSGPKKEDKRHDAPWMSGNVTPYWNRYVPRDNIIAALSKFDFLNKYMEYKTPERKEGKPKEDYDVRVARSISDLKWVSRLELCLPKNLFWDKYLSGKMMCKVPMTAVRQKLEIFFLLDDSGSMNDTYKVEWVVAILGTLLDAVSDGHAILYFASFGYTRSQFVKLDSSEMAEKFKQHFKPGSQGTTYLEEILPELAEDLKRGVVDGFELSNVMDILIVNDGQDDVPRWLELGVPCHAISVEMENRDLKQMCNNNGGAYYQAGATGDIQLL